MSRKLLSRKRERAKNQLERQRWHEREKALLVKSESEEESVSTEKELDAGAGSWKDIRKYEKKSKKKCVKRSHRPLSPLTSEHLNEGTGMSVERSKKRKEMEKC